MGSSSVLGEVEGPRLNEGIVRLFGVLSSGKSLENVENELTSPVSMRHATCVLARQRQDLIAEEVRRHGGVRVSDLTARFGISDMTVRRDLDVLATAGVIEKVHGGATAPRRPSSWEPGFTANAEKMVLEKDAIAAAAASR